MPRKKKKKDEKTVQKVVALEKTQAELDLEIEEHNKKIETKKIQREENNRAKQDIQKEIDELQLVYKERYSTGEVDFGEFFKKRGGYEKKLKGLNALDGNYSEKIKRGNFYFVTNYQNSFGKRDFTSKPVPGENVIVKFIDFKENSGIIIGPTRNKNDNVFISDNMNLDAGKAVLTVKEDLHVEKK